MTRFSLNLEGANATGRTIRQYAKTLEVNRLMFAKSVTIR